MGKSGHYVKSHQKTKPNGLRVAMLKARFSDTIFKATHQTIMDHGDKCDLAKMKLERERLEKEKRAASQRAQDVLKAQREKEREAARIALEKIERTVDIEDNLAVLREFEMLIFPNSIRV